MRDAPFLLRSKLILTGQIVARTGLHIGGSQTSFQIGGVDNPVVKDGEGRPYVPGSSLKGKLRALLERLEGKPPTRKIGSAMIHVCDQMEEYMECVVCRVFGVPAGTFNEPTRLAVRDAPLDAASILPMQPFLELPWTEVKYENALHRITSAAEPRQMERVPAGARFHLEMSFSVFHEDDRPLFRKILLAMRLLEDDALGGGGSRGSGRVAFTDLRLVERTAPFYRGVSHEEPLLAAGADVTTCLAALEAYGESAKR